MYFDKLSHPVHEGRETYRASYALKEHDDLYDVQGDFVKFTFRPETLHLKWERRLGQLWKPDDTYGVGTRITGRRVLKSGDLGDQQGSVGLYWNGELTQYAKSIPGLAELVAKIEAELPA